MSLSTLSPWTSLSPSPVMSALLKIGVGFGSYKVADKFYKYLNKKNINKNVDKCLYVSTNIYKYYALCFISDSIDKLISFNINIFPETFFKCIQYGIYARNITDIVINMGSFCGIEYLLYRLDENRNKIIQSITARFYNSPDYADYVRPDHLTYLNNASPILNQLPNLDEMLQDITNTQNTESMEDRLNRYTTLHFPGNNNGLSSDNITDICSVCRNELIPTQLIRELRCKHIFHPECIDNWIVSRGILTPTCPICREEIFI